MGSGVAQKHDRAADPALLETVLRLGDNALILGHELSRWTSNAATVELDIALANQALDLIGQARLLLDYAGRLEGKGRDEDDLAFGRDAWDFRNVLLVELPRGDFARTILRQFFYALWAEGFYDALRQSADETLSAIAGKSAKEMAYHVRHAGEWVVRLGDGTEESHGRLAAALAELWPYTHELFMADATDEAMVAAGIIPDVAALRPAWEQGVGDAVARAGLAMPDDPWQPEGGRRGVHSEHLGYILAEMQHLPRMYPGVKW
jgi:ring-1,2-phenylacetyl-CoA epoxidase subunit PaaC